MSFWIACPDDLEAFIGADLREYQEAVRKNAIYPPDDLLPELDDDGTIVGFRPRDEIEEDGESVWRPLNKWALPIETEAVHRRRDAFDAPEHSGEPFRVHWIKLADAAGRLSRCTKTLRRWREDGRIDESEMRRQPGGQWEVREDAVQRLLARE